MNGRPYAKTIEILESALRQVEKDAALNPNDADLLTLKSTLERRIASLDSRGQGAKPDAPDSLPN